jgi:hypothetical protein
VNKFDSQIWAEKIKLALCIKGEILIKNSLKILKEASTKKIDADYFKKMQSII